MYRKRPRYTAAGADTVSGRVPAAGVLWSQRNWPTGRRAWCFDNANSRAPGTRPGRERRTASCGQLSGDVQVYTGRAVAAARSTSQYARRATNLPSSSAL